MHAPLNGSIMLHLVAPSGQEAYCSNSERCSCRKQGTTASLCVVRHPSCFCYFIVSWSMLLIGPLIKYRILLKPCRIFQHRSKETCRAVSIKVQMCEGATECTLISQELHISSANRFEMGVAPQARHARPCTCSLPEECQAGVAALSE